MTLILNIATYHHNVAMYSTLMEWYIDHLKRLHDVGNIKNNILWEIGIRNLKMMEVGASWCIFVSRAMRTWCIKYWFNNMNVKVST